MSVWFRGVEQMLRRMFSAGGRLTALVIALMLAIFSLAGCQTVQGLGRDITTAGEAGEELIER
jgi:predicted small secreted protein